MKNMIEITELADELVEERILALLAPGVVLSVNEIAAALVHVADAGRIRRGLIDLRRQNAVSLQAQRRGLWYMGYARHDGVGRERTREEIPQPFRELLSRPW